MKLSEFINKVTENKIKDKIYALNHCVHLDYELVFRSNNPESIIIDYENKIIYVGDIEK